MQCKSNTLGVVSFTLADTQRLVEAMVNGSQQHENWTLRETRAKILDSAMKYARFLCNLKRFSHKIVRSLRNMQKFAKYVKNA